LHTTTTGMLAPLAGRSLHPWPHLVWDPQATLPTSAPQGRLTDNVTDRLPDALASVVAKRMRAAYRHSDPLVAQAEREALARELDRSHPGAAASLREGLVETLTIARLSVPPTLARTLRSTNTIESMIQICRDHAANVKRWQDGQMVLRWIAAGLGEARKQFRRVNGHLHLPALRATLDATIPAVTPAKDDAA
jgi:putative transposase